MSEFETLKDLVAAGRDRDRTALDVVRRPAPYSYNKFSTNVWKTGNLLGHYGVHSVGELAVAVGPKVAENEPDERAEKRAGQGRIDAAEPLLAILGGTLLGASVDLTPSEPVDAPALVAPDHWDVEATPSCTRLAYGGPPDDPDVTHFERSVWSENPIEPPEPVDPADEVLRFDGETYTHAELLAAVDDFVDEHDLDASTTVVLDGAITEPGGFLAGVLAPLAVGATIVVPDGEYSDGEQETDAQTLVVSDRETDRTTVTGAAVTDSMRDTRRT